MTSDIKHIAIIMDGNRRFAKRNGKEQLEGHKAGAGKLEEVLEWCKEFGVQELTVYAFSMQNFKRSEEEKEYLFKLIEEELAKFEKNKSKIDSAGLKIKIIGRKEMFPLNLQERFTKIEELTKNNSKKQFNLCVGYGGREEITDAVKKIVSENIPVEKITEEIVGEHLYLNSEPDICIRTSGEIRTSNFLPWQTIYSEWFFVNETWPEFSKETFSNILREFKEKRERRLGK